MDASRWRTATIAVTVVAALEFVALAGAGAALLGKPLSGRFKAEAAAAAAPRVRGQSARPARPTLTRSETVVTVLNGCSRTGAAASEAAAVRAKGYAIGSVGNTLQSGYTRTLLMYRPGYATEGARLGRDLNISLVTPLDGMSPRQLMGAHLVVIVGD
jgi:hypothetical protein